MWALRRSSRLALAAVATVGGLAQGCGSHGSDPSRPATAAAPQRPVAPQGVAGAVRSYALALGRSDWHGVCGQVVRFAYRQFGCYVADPEIPGPYTHVKSRAAGVHMRVLRVAGSRATASLTGPGMAGGDGEYTPQQLDLSRDRRGQWHVRRVSVPLPRRGVHGPVGENVVGTPYRTIVRRYGPPEHVTRHGGELCGNWDTVGDPYDWQFCFRRGVMTGAIGNQ